MTEHAINLVTKNVMQALKESGGRDLSAHSIFSPSGSHTWVYCSGSLIPSLFCEDTAGEDAAYGTVAHGIAEQWLKSGVKPDYLIGDTEFVGEYEILIDHAMLAYVEEYVDWCIYLPGDHFVEARVDHSDLTPVENQGGTADHAVCVPGRLTITDLKMGKGVLVHAENNSQAILYAWGFFRQYDELYHFNEIVIRICQPRLRHFDTWTITRDDLFKWAKWLKKRAYAAWCQEADRVPGLKQCQFCNIKHDCTALAVFIERILSGNIEQIEDPISPHDMQAFIERLENGEIELNPVDFGSLTIAQKATLHKYRRLVESFFEKVHEDLEKRVVNGDDVPGKKAVFGRSHRVFRENERTLEHLYFLGLTDDMVRPRKMITPSQCEDALMKLGYRRKQMESLLSSVVFKPHGKPTMVDADDPRPSIHTVVDDVFGNLDADDEL